jgi:hypothetical protein
MKSQEAIDCVVAELNMAAGETIAQVEPSSVEAFGTNTQVTLTGKRGTENGKSGEQISTNEILVAGTAGVDDAPIIAHTLGHTAGLLFPETNPHDVVHSADPDDIMFHEAQPWLTKRSLAAFAKQLKAAQ